MWTEWDLVQLQSQRAESYGEVQYYNDGGHPYLKGFLLRINIYSVLAAYFVSSALFRYFLCECQHEIKAECN